MINDKLAHGAGVEAYIEMEKRWLLPKCLLPFVIGRFEEEASFFPPIGVETYVEVEKRRLLPNMPSPFRDRQI